MKDPDYLNDKIQGAILEVDKTTTLREFHANFIGSAMKAHNDEGLCLHMVYVKYYSTLDAYKEMEAIHGGN
jgi:hypothetical protein